MSWFRKRPRQPAAPIIVPGGNVLLALTEECIALKVEAMTMIMLTSGVIKLLAGDAAGRAVFEGVIEAMKAKEEGRTPSPRPPLETMHELEKEVIGAVLEQCVSQGIALETMFMLGKGVTYRLGGEAAMARYTEKVTALMEMTGALQKLEKACR